MAVRSFFQDEINLVDPTKVLTFVVDPAYDYFDWSYNGLECKGGSDLGCEYAASELMEAMGFRWYAPEEWGRVRPDTIPTDLVHAQTTYWMPTNSIFLVYGHSWGGLNIASRDLLNNAQLEWETLNSLDIQPWPAGHRWGNIISLNVDFFEENPQLIKGGATSIASAIASNSFAGLHYDLAITDPDYTNLVNINAAQILETGLNEWHRTHFDPSDGDSNTPDQVFQFSKDVGEAARAGTPAIGDHPARAGVGDAMVGVYAYAGHRSPPTVTVAPEVFTQVALAFNDTGLSYVELVQQHGAKAAAVLIREYLDTQVWSDSKPFVQRSMQNNDFASYQDFHAAGTIGVNSEFGANWLVNMVGMRSWHRGVKTGVFNYPAALNDIMSKLFDEDPAVRDLYELWSDTSLSYNRWTLGQTFDHVAAMQDGWYKTLYQHFCVMLYERDKLPAKTLVADQGPLIVEVLGVSSSNPAVVTVDPADISRFTNGQWVKMGGCIDECRPANGMHEIASVNSPANTFQLVDVDTSGGSGQVPADWPMTANTDPYAWAFNHLMRKVVAVRDLGIVHSYAWIRQEANSAIGSYHLRLNYGIQPPAAWRNGITYSATSIIGFAVDTVDGSVWRCILTHTTPAAPITFAEDRLANPDRWVAYDGTVHGELPHYPNYIEFPVLPTEAEFDTYHAAIALETEREEILDNQDLVLTTGITPNPTTGNTTSTRLYVGAGIANYVYVGPGTVTITSSSGTTTVTEYGPGYHRLSTAGAYTVVWVGGMMFLDTFPSTRKDPAVGIGSGRFYMYIQSSVAGEVNIAAGTRWRFIDTADAIFNLVHVTSPAYIDPADLGPGQVGIDNANTRVDFYNNNVNRYISPKPDVALMPRPLAVQEFPSSLIVRRPV